MNPSFMTHVTHLQIIAVTRIDCMLSVSFLKHERILPAHPSHASRLPGMNLAGGDIPLRRDFIP